MKRAFLGAALALTLAGAGWGNAGGYDLTRLQHEVEQIRGLTFKSNVPSQMQTKPQIEQYLTKQLDADTNWKEMTAFLVAFGFVPENFSTRSVVLSLYGEQVGGYYDPGSRTFYLSQDFLEKNGGAGMMGISMADVTIAHELTHALQDQQWDLRALERSLKDATEDRSLAAEALIEGEATAVMVEQPIRAMGLDPGTLPDVSGLLQQSGVGSDDYPQFAKAPPYFKHGMMFPYVNGFHFVSALRKAGGWERVNEAWKRLPTSSDEILHPEHWLAHTPPTPAPTLPAFGAPSWNRATHGTLGEYLAGVLLEQYLPNKPDPETVTDGWKADSYAVYESPSHQFALVWESNWRDRVTASRMAGLIKQELQQRRPGMTPDGDGRWKLKDGRHTRVTWTDTTVLVEDAVP